MSYTKKKPYRHKGKAKIGSKPSFSDALMVKGNKGNKSSSDAYKDHIDGA